MDVKLNASLGWICFVAGMGYVGLGFADIFFPYAAGTSESMWRPEAGFLLFLLLMRPRAQWVPILITILPLAFLVRSWESNMLPAWAAGPLALVDVASTAAGALLLIRWAPLPINFQTLRAVQGLLLFPCVVAGGTAALFEFGLIKFFGTAPVGHGGLLSIWVREWLGYFLLTPWLCLAVNFRELERLRGPLEVLHAIAVAGMTAGCAWFAFLLPAGHPAGWLSFVYLPFPALVWAALRFGTAGATTCSLILGSIVFLQAARTPGLLESPNFPRSPSVLWLQLYVVASAGMSLLMAASTLERARAARSLEESEQRFRTLAEELRAAERHARRTEDLYRRAISAANAVPYLRDYRTEKFSFIGSNIRELTGYSATDMTPELWESITLEHVMRGWAEQMTHEEAVRVTRSGERLHWQADVLILAQGGREKWVSDVSVEIVDEQGKPIGSVGILMDITERKRAEVAVRKVNEGLEGRMIERTADLEAAVRELESFTYAVSHDLRAPLRAIDGFSRIIYEDHAQELSEEAASLLSRVRAASQKMDSLIKDLLMFSQLNRQALNRQSIDLNRLVRQSLEVLRADHQRRTIQIQHDDLPHTHGDPDLLFHVIHQLLSNAFKYTRNREVAQILVASKRLDEETVYFVRDNGVGFDMAYAEKLFGVFQKLHRAEEFEGSGVGLAVAQRIVRRHGGRIWAESKVDCGTTIYFTLRTENSSDPFTPAESQVPDDMGFVRP